jgi:hypothetical protein
MSSVWYSCDACAAYFPWWVPISRESPGVVPCDCGYTATYAVQPPSGYGEDVLPYNLRKGLKLKGGTPVDKGSNEESQG